VTGVVVALVAVIPAAAAVTACSAKHDPPPGELLLAIDSNLKVPDDVDEIGIAIASADGKTVTTDKVYGMAPVGDAKFPATLAIVRGTSGPIDIKVAGYKNSSAFVLRETVTTIPSDRTAVLRVDLNWLDNHSATGSGAPGSSVLSLEGTCGPGETSIAGTCGSFKLDSATLPTFTSDAVVPSDDTSACMNVTECLLGGGAAGGAVTVMASALTRGTAADGTPQCTVAPPAVAGAYNIGLQLPPGGDGWCDAASCVIPLENVAVDGWQLGSNGVIALPASVCTNAKVSALVFTPISDACPQYVSGHPACQNYGKDGGATEEAGPTSGDATVADAGDASDGAIVPPGDATTEAGPAPLDDSINITGYHLLGFASDDTESTIVAMMREDAGGGALVVWHDVPGQTIGTGVTVPLSDRSFATTYPIDLAVGPGVFAYSDSNAVQALTAAMPPADAGYLGGSLSTPSSLFYVAADGGARLVFAGYNESTDQYLVVQQPDGTFALEQVLPGPVTALAPERGTGRFAIAEDNTAVASGYAITLGTLADANPANNAPPVVVPSYPTTAVAFPGTNTLAWWFNDANATPHLFYASTTATRGAGTEITPTPGLLNGPRSMVGGGSHLFWIGAKDQHIYQLTFAAGAPTGNAIDLSAMSLKSVTATQLGLTSMHLLYTDGETFYRYPLQDLP
jgi:hypothetical protein